MATTTTQTQPQVNGDKPTYESKFLPKVTSIPIVQSFKKHLFIHVPQAEALTNYIGDQLVTAFKYTDDTPIQGAVIKLDTLAATGVEKLQKQVPIVNAPTAEIRRKTKIDSVLGFLTHYYVASIDFVLSFFNAYKGVFDPVLLPFLDRVEAFFNIKSTKPESTSERIKRIRGIIIEKADVKVTPTLVQTKETISSIYTTKIVPLTQYPINMFNVQKDKATETVSPLVSEVNTRLTKAESAAKDAWIQTKPDISGPTSVIPTIKSVAFTALTFGYKVIYPEKSKQEAKDAAKGVEDQTNGLVSGVDLSDGHATKKRPNGVAS